MSTALASPLVAHPMGEAFGKQMMVYTTLNPNDDKDKIMLASCMLAYTSIKDTDGKPTPVINYLEWDDVDIDETTGEQKMLHKCGFIDRDGQVFYTTSAQFPVKMSLFMRMFGPPPWSPPRWFIFGEDIAKKSGRIYHWFRPANPPPGMGE